MSNKQFFIILTSMLIAFTGVVYLISNDTMVDFDLAIVRGFQNIRTANLTFIVELITGLCSRPQIVIIVILVTLFLLIKKHYQYALFFAIVNVGGAVSNRVLKEWFIRERPNIDPYRLLESYSFPSGHATRAMVLFGIILFIVYRLFPRYKKSVTFLSITMILLIGLSRPYLGVHYVTDIIAGYLAGGIWLIISIFTFDHLIKRKV